MPCLQMPRLQTVVFQTGITVASGHYRLCEDVTKLKKLNSIGSLMRNFRFILDFAETETHFDEGQKNFFMVNLIAKVQTEICRD